VGLSTWKDLEHEEAHKKQTRPDRVMLLGPLHLHHNTLAKSGADFDDCFCVHSALLRYCLGTLLDRSCNYFFLLLYVLFDVSIVHYACFLLRLLLTEPTVFAQK